MPELPEVETIKNTVAKTLLHERINNVTVRQRKFRQNIPDDFEKRIVDATVVALRRIAKYMLVDLDNGQTIIWHFGMSGKIKIESALPKILDKHDHIIFETSNGVIIYNDVRRFGLVTVCESAKLNENPLLAELGLDPWEKKLTPEYLLNKLKKKKCAVKISLLDQSIICGIGNIYASEILYKARILPNRESDKVSLEECSLIIKYTREILEKAIAAGGSTIHDFKRPDGDIGYFQNQHCVYNKTGKCCPDCVCGGKKHIEKIVLGGRSTFFCPVLQK